MFHNNFIQLIETALQGNNEAIQELRYKIHDGLPIKEKSILLSHLEQPIANNNSNALYFRGLLYTSDEPPNYISAFRYFQQAIDLGNSWAMSSRAYYYEVGKGGKTIDYPAAISLYESAISLGNVYAMCERAFMHYNGSGGSVNYQAAISLYERAICLSDPSAMFNRAIIYLRENGSHKDYNNAMKLFLDAFNYTQKFSFYTEVHTSAKEDIAEIIKNHLNKLTLTPQYIFELLKHGLLPDEKIVHFVDEQKAVFYYMRTLPEADLFEALQDSLNANHSLGKFFRLPENFISRTIFKKKIQPWDEGTTLNLIFNLHQEMKDKRASISSLSSTATLTTLIPVYLNEEEKSNVATLGPERCMQTVTVPAESTYVQPTTTYVPPVYVQPVYVQPTPSVTSETSTWDSQTHPELDTFIPVYPAPPPSYQSLPPSYLFTITKQPMLSRQQEPASTYTFH